MKIEVHEEGDIVIVAPEGDIKVGEGDIALREAILKQIEAGQQKLVLDLGNVRFMDSAGLGELVVSLRRVHEAGGAMRIAAVNQRITDALTVTQLVRVLDIYPDIDAAVTAFTSE